jgi:lipid II:glycine glycyltransferase (peptidoglycan interpeptide bridge formation enzyme)
MKAKWPPWGLQLFGAVEGEEVLSAALIGWAGARAFYVTGGSTPAGYESAAAFWMHWSIMLRLREAGLQVYNLGGVPADAAEEGHVQHGLFRFKRGFGGSPVACGGGSATLHPGHAKRHALASRLKSALLSRGTYEVSVDSPSNGIGG